MAFIGSVTSVFRAIPDIGITPDIRPEEAKHIRYLNIGFALMGLNYAMLLSLLVGLSVIIPYVGATIVTIPVMLIAFFQFGSEPMFGYVLLFYAIVQFLDGNLLVPLLFSEVVNLHPVAIIVAVVFFGSLWGVWGVFFAIPLATLIQAVINVWPKQKNLSAESAD